MASREILRQPHPHGDEVGDDAVGEGIGIESSPSGGGKPVAPAPEALGDLGGRRRGEVSGGGEDVQDGRPIGGPRRLEAVCRGGDSGGPVEALPADQAYGPR